MMTNEFEGTAITVMPNGSIYEGAHEGFSHYPNAPLLGRYRWSRQVIDERTGKYALKAKTMLNAKLTKTFADIMSLPLEASSFKAASNPANKTNLSHIQLIRLFPELQGAPERFFWLDECFVERDVPQLELREPYRNVSATVQKLGRLQRADHTKTKYDEIKYDLSKLADNVYTPIEDVYRTIINPTEVDISQVAFGFAQKRNDEAHQALKDMGTAGYNFGSVASPSAMTAGNFHSDNKTVDAIADLFVAFRKAQDVVITHTAMNSKTARKINANTWTESGGPTGIIVRRIIGGGVYPFPGIANVSNIIDDVLADDKIYAFNKPFALRRGEGPKVMRRFYDNDLHADAISYLDFVQYLSADKQLTKIGRKFGGVITVS